MVHYVEIYNPIQNRILCFHWCQMKLYRHKTFSHIDFSNWVIYVQLSIFCCLRLFKNKYMCTLIGALQYKFAVLYIGICLLKVCNEWKPNGTQHTHWTRNIHGSRKLAHGTGYTQEYKECWLNQGVYPFFLLSMT